MGFFKKQKELYEFKIGNSFYRYTDAAKTIEFNGADYLPEIIGRDNIKVTNEIGKNDLTVLVKDDNQIAKTFIVGIPEERVFLKLYQQDSAIPANFNLIYSGNVVTKEFSKGHKTKLIIQSLSQTAEVNGLTRRYSKTCTHVLYDPDTCKAGKIIEITTVIGIAGRDITLAGIAQPDGFYNGGAVTIGGSKRTIGAHVGNVITIISPIVAKIGDVANIEAGCNHSINICDSKFSNLLNFGGQPFIPEENPFEGNLL